MSQQSGKQRTRVASFPWFRAGLALLLAGLAATVAPLLIPNLAFQILAVVNTAVVVWDARRISNFYGAMFDQFLPRFRSKIGEPWLIILPGLLFTAIILVLLMNIVVSPIQLAFLHYDTAPVLLGTLTVMLVLPSLHLRARQVGLWLDSKLKLLHAVFLCFVMAALFCAQLTIAKALYQFPGWDAGAVLSNAFGLADHSLATMSADYFAKYPNNITLTLLIAAFSRVMIFFGVTDLLWASVVLNVVALLTGVLLTYLVARRLAGTGAAILTLLPSTVFVVVSPWIAVPYSDTFGLPFPLLLIYLYLRAKEAARLASRLVLWAAMGLTGVIGFNIKPTVVFVLVGVVVVTVMTAVLKREKKHQIGSVLTSVAVLAATFGAGSVALTQLERSTSVVPFDVKENTQAVPLTHFLKMGAQGYGTFNEADVHETVGIADPHERFVNGLKVYAQRVEAMGVGGYADFLRRKALWTYGDGTFFMWSEGLVANQEDPFLSKDPLSRDVQDYLWVRGENFPFTTGVWQSTWLAILLLVGIAFFLRGNKLFSSSASIMRIALLCLFLFLLLFETRSRYLYLYLPYFILLATLTLESVVSRADSFPARAPELSGRRSSSNLPVATHG
ncbi:4-amino-4-deoxy-L-arabinose transferase-like glycosyltransferase [Arthrobacter sp. B2I5]|uniref:glycosyltransferase family 39 protein n=1 Tax=Arthrobacter sp. B2I5 TaxID=3042266 RepID=UPI002789E3E3|nr:glycosyltransferase family 39 protein [Arthrobacter sp. B2I5]MDQ0827259.1 4-amino-4-deoxy-L-arabinose transferase-like glycosyltransferase [Arthrobacter sp. B2I5]